MLLLHALANLQQPLRRDIFLSCMYVTQFANFLALQLSVVYRNVSVTTALLREQQSSRPFAILSRSRRRKTRTTYFSLLLSDAAFSHYKMKLCI